MNIELTISYYDQSCQLDVIIDGKTWYQELMNATSGLSKDFSIGEHYLSVHILPTSIEKET